MFFSVLGLGIIVRSGDGKRGARGAFFSADAAALEDGKVVRGLLGVIV